jgi:hypothetical protein
MLKVQLMHLKLDYHFPIKLLQNVLGVHAMVEEWTWICERKLKITWALVFELGFKISPHVFNKFSIHHYSQHQNAHKTTLV